MYDLVVSYVDSNKEDWLKSYNKYKEEEIKNGQQSADNRQAFGIERTRDWDTLRYYLRGVENNCKWVRNIIILMQNKNQIPDWLDTSNSRLRVVFHEDYIDKEILPTFNSCEIGMYVSNIKDLSDYYVISDDDFYFINEISADMFFRNNKTVQPNNKMPYEFYNESYTNASDGVFYKTLNNNFKIEKRYGREKYFISHMPSPRDKKMEQKILEENKELFLEAFKKSRFRSEHSYSAEMFPNILKITKNCEFLKSDENYCRYVTLKSDVDFDKYKDYKIVCFNDTEQLDDFELTKEKLIQFLESRLSNKSSFERW